MGVKYLLDTHAFIWLLSSPARLNDDVLAMLANPANPLFVSSASAMEVATKVRLGKFPDAAVLVDSWATQVNSIGAEDLPIRGAHALLAGRMEWAHRDPFDRLLAAQALLDNLALVTGDHMLHGLPGLRILMV